MHIAALIPGWRPSLNILSEVAPPNQFLDLPLQVATVLGVGIVIPVELAILRFVTTVGWLQWGWAI